MTSQLNKFKKLKQGSLMIVLGVMLSGQVFAKKVDIDVTDAPVVPIIKSLARLLGHKVIMGGHFEQHASLYMHQVEPGQALKALLIMQGLAKWPIQDIWYIAPRAELLKRKQAYAKLRSLEQTLSPLDIRTWRIHYAKAKDIASYIQNDKSSLLSKKGHIQQDSRSNTLSIQDTRESLSKIAQLINVLDVPLEQIRIKVKLVSIDRDIEKKLGIDFSQHSPGSPSLNVNQYSLLVSKLTGGHYLDVTLAALEREGRAELISSPSLFASNQETASIETGEELPYQEVSQGGGTAVSFKKAVLSLKVLPHVLPDQKVLLKIKVNQDRPSERMVLGVPSIRTRQMTTSVVIKNGETVVLGGIYEINKEQGDKRIPLLGSIPFLGVLFSQHVSRKSKRELLVFVTPTIY